MCVYKFGFVQMCGNVEFDKVKGGLSRRIHSLHAPIYFESVIFLADFSVKKNKEMLSESACVGMSENNRGCHGHVKNGTV